MSAAPFINILTPLFTLLITVSMFIFIWGCLTIILASYGLDLAGVVPWIHIDDSSSVAMPVALLIVVGLSYARARKAGGSEIWNRMNAAGLLLAVATVPFLLRLSFPEIWAIIAVAAVWFGWRQISAWMA